MEVGFAIQALPLHPSLMLNTTAFDDDSSTVVSAVTSEFVAPQVTAGLLPTLRPLGARARYRTLP